MRYGFIKWDFKYKILIIDISATIIAAYVTFRFSDLTIKEQIIKVFRLCVFTGILIIPSTYVLDKLYQEKKKN